MAEGSGKRGLVIRGCRQWVTGEWQEGVSGRRVQAVGCGAVR